jgi:hypothetical protein
LSDATGVLFGRSFNTMLRDDIELKDVRKSRLSRNASP